MNKILLNPEQYAQAKSYREVLIRLSQDAIAEKLTTEDEEKKEHLSNLLAVWRAEMEEIERQINDYDNI